MRFLLEHFNVAPDVGWQIDPFGHSSTMMGFSKLMGFNAVFFPRIDYQEKQARKRNKTLEFIMHPFRSQDAPIFIHINYVHYEAPPGFDFDVSSSVRLGKSIF